eukprot:1187455-Prorocentrum_minimum.AAC.1
MDGSGAGRLPTSPAHPCGSRPFGCALGSLMASRGSLARSLGFLLATLGSLGSLLASLGSLPLGSAESCLGSRGSLRGTSRGSRALESYPALGSLRSLGSGPRSASLWSRDIRSWAGFLDPEAPDALWSRDMGSDSEGRLDDADGWPAKRGFTCGARSSGRPFSIWASSVGGNTCCRCQVANSFSSFCCSAGLTAQLRYTFLNTCKNSVVDQNGHEHHNDQS